MNAAQLDTTSGPLSGYRVLDLTTFLSGPFCTQILADLGAEVVKLEAPEGDSSRSIPPHFVAGESAYFLGVNRSKRSIAIDMKQPEGLALAQRLISEADVVVENFRPGVAARIGLHVEALRAAHPRLIWASISGFGQTGPWRERPAYDMIVQALSGVMSLTGEPDRAAVRLGIPAGDIVAGMYAAIAINAALADRERHGQGRLIDISMLDCQLAMLSYQSTYALVAGVTPQPQGARHDSIPTYRSFVAGDGRELVVTANTERMWRGLCEALGCSDLLEDRRFADGASRLEHRDALWPLLEKAFLARPAADWIDPLHTHGVPVALIRNVPEALQDARESGRGMVVELAHPDGRSVEVVGNPIKFGGLEPAASYPPALGESGEQVLAEWLGLDTSEVARLHGARVLVQRRTAPL
ncbi:CaiB/BaiF CoA-transferase family protein [Variovorax sp. Sphag1AA]|uniref:CaiB/BaiF CoA transferase family protein n=1 Tax=Variovorax sp. Sphag1AA TaxID=2587027 RepID=UPI00160E4E26|nr:CoA transferase [Variovorax sp. Sphag1AA]MBB3177976.1 crotonobetainyl-CoA:carnitine CoA-transferase CaiB-like acyl-CoA transferase [Variovorax sp. Sphag1AA]